MNDTGHAHGPAASSQRGSYADFVDELFRLKQIARDKRDFLREGLSRASGGPAAPEPLVPPSSAPCAVSEAGLKRAADAKLVETLGGARHPVKPRPDPLHSGYLCAPPHPLFPVH